MTMDIVDFVFGMNYVRQYQEALERNRLKAHVIVQHYKNFPSAYLSTFGPYGRSYPLPYFRDNCATWSRRWSKFLRNDISVNDN